MEGKPEGEVTSEFHKPKPRDPKDLAKESYIYSKIPDSSNQSELKIANHFKTIIPNDSKKRLHVLRILDGEKEAFVTLVINEEDPDLYTVSLQEDQGEMILEELGQEIVVGAKIKNLTDQRLDLGSDLDPKWSYIITDSNK